METITGNTEFKIFTGLLKTSRGPDGKMRLHGVASSTTKDLHGDTMLASAIDDMERAANNNLTIFLNHSYNVPEDVGGSVERAKSVTRGVDHQGNPNIDLNFDVVINEANPRAVNTFEAIERGTKLGLSIGAMIPDGGAKRQKDGTYLIEHVDLLETSIVGIPANPRSWVEYAVKAIKSKSNKDKTTTVPLGTPTLTISNNEYTITGTLDNTSVVFDSIDAVAESFETGETVAEQIDELLAAPVEADVEPDIQDTSVTIIQIDTSDDDDDDDADDDRSPGVPQDAQESTPDAGTGLLDETADGDDEALGDVVTNAMTPDAPKALTEALALLRETTRDLIETKEALQKAERARLVAEADLSRALDERNEVLRATKSILDRIGNTPLSRKTVVVDARRDFSRYEGLYSEDVLKMLESNHE